MISRFHKPFFRSKALLCAGLLLTSTLGLFGCSSGQTSQAKVYEEPLVIDVFDSLANYQGMQSGWFAKLVKDKFNMELNIIAPNVSGGGDTLYRTRAAAGNLGDLIICSGQNNNLQDLVTAGLVIDMQDYLKDAEIMKYEKAIRNLNGPVDSTAIYAIPSSVSFQSCTQPSESGDPTFGPYLRYDLYAALGYPSIKTLDDLLGVLAQMQALQPVSESGNPTYAFSFFKDWDGNMMNSAKQPACFYGYDEYGFVLAKADGSDYQDIMQDDSFYLRNLKMYFDANQLGLVDPASPNQNYNEMFDKYAAGDILYAPWPWLGQSAYNTLSNRTSGKGFMFVPIEDMQILLNGCNPYGDDTSIIAVGRNAKDPERLADFINWLYSPEGIYANSAQSVTGTAGPEGLTWEMTGDGPALTEVGVEALLRSDVKLPDSWGGGMWKDGISRINFTTVILTDTAPNGYPYRYTQWDSYRQMDDTTLEKAWKNHMQADSTMDYLLQTGKYLVSPGCSYFSTTESNEISTIRNQCKRIIVDTSWAMVFAKDEETFYELQSTMQETVRSLGYEQVLLHDMDLAHNKINAKIAAAAAERGNHD